MAQPSRPASQASQRSSSRLSQRPQSRISALRPTQRVPPRPSPLYAHLYAAVVGNHVPKTGRDPALYVASLIDKPDYHGSVLSAEDIKARINGLVLKTKINLKDQLAQAIRLSYSLLDSPHVGSLGDPGKIKKTTVPSHLQFLLALSLPPSAETVRYADLLLNPIAVETASTDLAIWKEIMGELQPEPLSEAESSGEDSSDPESTLRDSEIALDLQPPSQLSEESKPKKASKKLAAAGGTPYLWSHRDEYEDYISHQYWKLPAITKATVTSSSRFIPPSNLARTTDGLLPIQAQVVITESEALRECIMTLQGRSTILFERSASNTLWSPCFVPSKDGPLVAHLTPISQNSLLSQFAIIATRAEQLRAWSKWLLTSSGSDHVCYRTKHLETFKQHRTLRTFAGSVRDEVAKFDMWCAEQETQVIDAITGVSNNDFVVSLLSFCEMAHCHSGDNLDILLELVLQITASSETCTAPAVMTCLVLDSISASYDKQLAIGNKAALELLTRALKVSIAPTWADIGVWLFYGMSFQEEDHGTHFIGSSRVTRQGGEFFVERSDCPIDSTNFWADGYTIAKDVHGAAECIPRLFSGSGDSILAAGKALGLLRTLGGDFECTPWPSTSLLDILVHESPSESGDIRSLPSSDDMRRQLRASLGPWCEHVQQSLVSYLGGRCGLYTHLAAVENLGLMHCHSTLTLFCDAIFTRMDRRQPWTDFHWLNAILLDSLTSSKAEEGTWIDPSLVRFAYRGSLSTPAKPTVQILLGLNFHYGFPFPLTYIWDKCETTYSEILVFLIQLRRARRALESVVLLCRWNKLTGALAPLVRQIYKLRSRLTWVIDTLTSFVGVDVISISQSSFRRTLSKAKTVDSLISSHREYLKLLKEQCFLSLETGHLRTPIIDLLDLCLEFQGYIADVFREGGSRETPGLPVKKATRRKRKTARDQESAMNAVTLSREYSLLVDELTDSDGEERIDQPSRSPRETDERGLAEMVEYLSSAVNMNVKRLRRGIDTLLLSETISSQTRVTLHSLSDAFDNWDA